MTCFSLVLAPTCSLLAKEECTLASYVTSTLVLYAAGVHDIKDSFFYADLLAVVGASPDFTAWPSNNFDWRFHTISSQKTGARWKGGMAIEQGAGPMSPGARKDLDRVSPASQTFIEMDFASYFANAGHAMPEHDED